MMWGRSRKSHLLLPSLHISVINGLNFNHILPGLYFSFLLREWSYVLNRGISKLIILRLLHHLRKNSLFFMINSVHQEDYQNDQQNWNSNSYSYNHTCVRLSRTSLTTSNINRWGKNRVTVQWTSSKSIRQRGGRGCGTSCCRHSTLYNSWPASDDIEG